VRGRDLSDFLGSLSLNPHTLIGNYEAQDISFINNENGFLGVQRYVVSPASIEYLLQMRDVVLSIL